jgi:hypothetical protein
MMTTGSTQNQMNCAAITKQASDLCRRYPQFPGAIRAFLGKERKENAVLVKDLICAAWPIHKQRKAGGPHNTSPGPTDNNGSSV